MKKKIIALMIALSMLASFPLAACNNNSDDGPGGGNNPGGNNPGGNTDQSADDAENWYTDYKEVSNEDYNKSLYYLNELKFEVADPTVIYVDRGEEKGYFYAYGTSDLVGGYGIQCWRSKDLTNWEYKSVAYKPDFAETWASRNHWAPEVLYDEKQELYLMIYNADYVEGDIYTDEWSKKGENSKSMTVVCAEEPYGPFIEMTPQLKTRPAYDFSPRNSAIPKELQRSNTIDGHLYIDPVGGKKYLYYSGYGYDGNKVWHGQTLFGVEMKNWLEPDYSTLKELTKNFKTTVDLTYNDIDEGDPTTVNEGAFMWYEDGVYYLTFSVYGFTDPMYQVRQAVSDSPMGPFTKIKPRDGGQVLVTDPAWDEVITSAGHHCFIPCGDELIIAYHTFLNRSDIDNGRALAVDTVSWVTNAKGQKLMHANGPTYSYQPLPEEISGYKNLAPQANITANNADADSDVKYLNDETIKVHSFDPVQEFTTSGGKTEIKLSFGKYVNARSIMVYNASDYDRTFTEITSIKLNCKGVNGNVVKEIKNVPFDFEWHTDLSSMVYPGATAIAEFDELPVNEITITVNCGPDDILAFNEIIVLGKEVDNPEPVTALKEYSYTNPAPVSSVPVYTSNTFGSAGDGFFMSDYGFNLEHDDGTENAYVEKDWAGNMQNLYFKDVESTVFYVEVRLSTGDIDKAFNNDPAPKAGIVMRSRNKYFVSYNIDYTTSFSNPKVGFVESKSDGSDYDWSKYLTYSVEGLKYSGSDSAKLAVARVGKQLYLFANDKLVAKFDTLRGFLDREDTACAISLVTFNCYTKFSGYSVTTDADEVNAKIQQLTTA